MTTLDILGGDWRISFDDETVNSLAGQAGLRKIEYISGPRRSLNAIYSAVADNADFFQAMTFTNPMLPVTPNQYTAANDYFIPRSSMEQTFEGGMSANWALKTVGPDSDTFGHGVIKKQYVVGLGTNFVAGDIGRRVVESASGDTGTLLDYDIEPDGTLVAWIRPDDSTPVTGDIFDSTTGTISVTADSGTGSVDVSVAGESGLTEYAAIQAIGSVPTATEVYVLQNRLKLADSATNTDQYWVTDTTVSLGIVSISVMVRNSGTLIADGDLEVFARRYTSLYDNFRLNVAGLGFSALPLASAPDINNTTGYRTTGAMTASAGTFDVGNGIYQGASWAAATARGIVTAVTGTNPNVTVEYYLVGTEIGALPDLASTTASTEYDFATALDGDASGTTGTVGVNSGGPTDVAAGEGGTVTIALGAVTTVDHDGDGTNENYSITIDAQTDVPIAKVYERLKYVTRRSADEADLFGAGTNVPGETYRGIEAVLEYDANTGTMTDGDDLVITAKTNHSSRLVAQNTTPADSVATYISMMDIQTSLTSAQPADNDVVDDETGDDVTLHAGGTLGLNFFSSPKAAPFGTFTGSQIFGARGVVYINPASTDVQAYILTDDTGVLRTPPNTIALNIQNTRVGDRIMAARDTGVAGVIDKDQFGGLAAPMVGYNNQDDLTVRVAGTIDNEVPDASIIRVVETTLLQEHRYYYSSVTKQASGEFTLTALTGGNTGAATATSTTQLVDDGRNFLTDGVLVGMLVRNTTLGKTGHVWEVTGFSTTGLTANDTLEVRPLYGTPDDWDNTDTYIINALIQTYAATDDIFDLILDVEEDTGTDGTPGSEQNTFVKTPAADFDVVINVRNGKIILPFDLNQTISDTTVNVTVVRQPDTIAT